MRPRSLRGRVALGAALAIVVAVGALGLTLALLAGRELRGSLDQTLRERAAEVSRLSASAPALLTAPGALTAPLGGRELAVEVLDRRGRILARSPALAGRIIPGGSLTAAALAQGRSGYEDARLSGDPVRVFVAPLPDAGGPAAGGAVLVASSTVEIHETLSRVRVLIALCAIAAAALGAGLVALVAGRGLRPLRRLAGAAAEIERSGDARQRLPTAPPAAAEIGELTATLNRMLAALDRARDTERRFLADASHELRTPLTALRGNAAYIARHGPDPDALADLEADAARVGRLIGDLLDLERAGASGATPSAVRLDEIVAAAVRRAPRVRADVAAPLSVRGERGAIERALDNLIENAQVHGPAGGDVRVTLRSDGEWALLAVEDAGQGIPPDQVEAAFGRFWRGPAAAERPGSGLGLAIVRATAESLGGSVEVAGARVTLRLPLAGRDGGPAAPAPDAAGRAR